MNIKESIERLRRERKALVLAHTYQPAEIQDVADFVGDSYGLSARAARAGDAEMIVFCGVRFMAETAAILNPGKRVVMPVEDAGCPMADMIDARRLEEFKAAHPGAPVVCYINSTAEVKAGSTICCTSSNALKVVASLGDVPEILFVPDQYLGRYVEKTLGRKLVLWNGYCPVHRALDPESIRAARRLHPGVPVMVHPETRPEVQAEADHVLSTGQMLEMARGLSGRECIIGTERGILHALEKAVPGGVFVPVEPPLVCADMKKASLESVLEVLETGGRPVQVPAEVAGRALKAIEAMLAL